MSERGPRKGGAGLPAGFVVRHEIPPGMQVSLAGLGPQVVRLFSTEAKRRAGLDVWDEERFWRERGKDGAQPE